MIRVDKIWLAVEPMDMRAGPDTALVAGGPGFANSLSPVFSAKHAESPILLLSGDTALSEDGLGGFQEMDQLMMTQPLVKLGLRPKRVDDLANHTIDLTIKKHPKRKRLAKASPSR